jgi:hypothetical protein
MAMLRSYKARQVDRLVGGRLANLAAIVLADGEKDAINF